MKKLNVIFIILIGAIMISGCQTKHGEVIAEYSINYDNAFTKVDKYNLIVFEDGTGKYSVYNEYDNKVLKEKEVDISIDEVNLLLSVIEDNDFWNVSTEQLDEGILICDGESVTIKGKDKDREHEIEYTLFDDDIEVSNILKAFADFADENVK